MNTLFTFVRHGETDANRNGILQGQKEYPLNSAGIAQAEAVAEYLQDREFDVIYSSDLSRAAVTAQKIIDTGHKNVPLILTAQLRELDCGDLSGWNYTDLREKYPEKMDFFYRESGSGAFPGGESKIGFQVRIDEFLQDVLNKHRGKKILLISHGGVLMRIFRSVAGIGGAHTLLPLAGNASVNEFQYSEKFQSWQLTQWNFREHLKNIPQHQTLVL